MSQGRLALWGREQCGGVPVDSFVFRAPRTLVNCQQWMWWTLNEWLLLMKSFWAALRHSLSWFIQWSLFFFYSQLTPVSVWECLRTVFGLSWERRKGLLVLSLSRARFLSFCLSHSTPPLSVGELDQNSCDSHFATPGHSDMRNLRWHEPLLTFNESK